MAKSKHRSWSGLGTKKVKKSKSTNDYMIGSLISGVSSDMSDTAATFADAYIAEKEAEKSMAFEKSMKKRENLAAMSAGSEGVVPGTANPYALALGGSINMLMDGGDSTSTEVDTEEGVSADEVSDMIGAASGSTATAAATMYTASMDQHMMEQQRAHTASKLTSDILANANRSKSMPSTYNSNEVNPNMLATGGLSESTDLTEYGAGGLHEQNPLGGIPLGTGDNGKTNTVEQGENSYQIGGKKYVFSNRLIV